MLFRATNHPNHGPRQRFHPFSDTSDTCNLQLVHATLSVITALKLAGSGSHIYQIS